MSCLTLISTLCLILLSPVFTQEPSEVRKLVQGHGSVRIKLRQIIPQALPPEGMGDSFPVTMDVYKLVRPLTCTFPRHHVEATRSPHWRSWRQVHRWPISELCDLNCTFKEICGEAG